jgi:SnoaL-like polyketide cyclase
LSLRKRYAHSLGLDLVQNQDGSRVASRWRVTGRNNGLMGTEPNGAPFEMTGTAVWEIGADGRLRHNWVERNAYQVYGALPDRRHNVF